jgi:hypothetical protein
MIGKDWTGYPADICAVFKDGAAKADRSALKFHKPE